MNIEYDGLLYEESSSGKLILLGTTDALPENLVIPGSISDKKVVAIDESAFCRCSSLTSVVIPNSVTEIGWSAFSCCSSLTSVVIPESVTEIGKSAFKDCTSLTSVGIPDSVTEIGGDAFYCCPNLTIHCAQGSAARAYAEKNDIPYEDL